MGDTVDADYATQSNGIVGGSQKANLKPTQAIHIPRYNIPTSDAGLDVLERKLAEVLQAREAISKAERQDIDAVSATYSEEKIAYTKHAVRIAQKILFYTRKNRVRLMGSKMSVKRAAATLRFGTTTEVVLNITTEQLVKELERRLRFDLLTQQVDTPALRRALQSKQTPIQIRLGKKVRVAKRKTFGIYSLPVAQNISRRLGVLKGQKASWTIRPSTRGTQNVPVEED